MRKTLLPLARGLLVLAGSVTAAPLGTAFTYQGRLDQNGQPVLNGVYQVNASLFSQLSGGLALASNSGLLVGVTNGLFTVDLDFGGAAFTGEARWLELAVRTNNNALPFNVLAPRTRLAPIPNAIFASTAGTVTNGGIQANQLKTTGTPLPGQVLGYDGSSMSLVWQNPSVPGGLTLPYVGTAASGNPLFQVTNSGTGGASEGIVGTTASSVSQVAGVRGIGASSSGTVVGVYGVAVNSPDGTGVVGYGGATGGYFTATRPGGHAGVFDGSVVVNTQDALRLVGYQPFLTFFDHNAGDARGRIQSLDGDLTLEPESFIAGPNYAHGLTIKSGTGNVGIGTTMPEEKLHVNGAYVRVEGLGGEQAYLGGDGAANDVQVGSFNPSVTAVSLWNVPNAQFMDLNVRDLSTRVLTIRGGADLAEPFPIKDETIEKGSVVVIDKENPGQLKRSTKAYDKRVAGIVSGANGINPGIALKQEGALDHGENVALTGRVYVKADATYGVIEPGDLLTTSDTPGHAMRVTDSARAQGAILGKAMSALAEGKGLVLVLVTLQ
jgi:hypothetical protein